MDFTQRGNHQMSSAGGDVSTGGHRGRKSRFSWLRLGMVLLLFSATILIVALLISIATGTSNTKQESKYVNDNELQAVFLNGGQVYFGDIRSLNDRYIRMSNIYYLRVNQTVQPKQGQQANNNDISLVKLGCELHGPEDAMVINREQVIFWENLKADGQVAKAVAQYVKQNPTGQKCDTTTKTNSTNPATNP